jgi:hypothetical protein
MINKKLLALPIAAAIAAISLTGCASDAQVVADNLSQSADKFQINRRVVFFNGITDKYLLEIDGFCSVETGNSSLKGSLQVTCKTGPGQYKKHFLGLSDNVSYFVEQIDSANVSRYHYQVMFKPEEVIPDIQLRTSATK